MDSQEKVATAFWTQLSILSIPLSILLVLKIVAFLFRTFVSEERMNRWFKPSNIETEEEAVPVKPKLTKGPFIEKESSEMQYLDNINSLIKVVVRKSEDRGLSDNQSWLSSYHTFSFGKYTDPKFIGFGSMRILNEETIKAGGGYPQLVRQDYEILTIVISGSIRHLDSLDNEVILPAGNAQVMTCGKGITHVEENASLHSEVHYLQLWLVPNFGDLKPNYQKRDFSTNLLRNKLVAVASPYRVVDRVAVQNVTTKDLAMQKMPEVEILAPSLYNAVSKGSAHSELMRGDIILDATTKIDSTIGLYSDTYIHQCVLEPGCKVRVPITKGKKRKAYLHVFGQESKGMISVNYEERLKPGDGAFIGSLNGVTFIDLKNIGKETCQFVFLDMA